MIIEKFFNIFSSLAPAGCQGGFLSLKTWYYYLPSSDFSGCNIRTFTIFPQGGQPSDIPLVLVAVIDDLLQIAGLVALAFIFVGAIKFITSEGNSDKATNARNTIINALAGLAIAVVAVVFVNFIGTRIG